MLISVAASVISNNGSSGFNNVIHEGNLRSAALYSPNPLNL
jgi:hypothetical protein